MGATENLWSEAFIQWAFVAGRCRERLDSLSGARRAVYNVFCPDDTSPRRFYGRFRSGKVSPFLAEGAYFHFKRPGAARLLIKLPIGFRDRRWRHQQIGIVERVRPQRFDPPLPHPFGVDAGVDDEMGDVNVLRTQFARGRLGHRTESEFGAGERSIARSAAHARGSAS